MENLNNQIHFGFGWVSHSRVKKNLIHFKYPIFNIFLPLKTLKAKKLKIPKLKILSLSSIDYINKENETISCKIESFLKENFNITADQIILQTLPKMLGYAFNPVSFWWLLKEDQVFALLCEVNNTFGDKHFYFFETTASQDKICKPKEFHVSPFLNIEGHYEFIPLFNNEQTSVKIDYYDKDMILILRTQIFLVRKPLSTTNSLSLLMKYGWMTPLIMFKIHWHALKLWIKKVPFFSRPLPPQKEITK